MKNIGGKLKSLNKMVFLYESKSQKNDLLEASAV